MSMINPGDHKDYDLARGLEADLGVLGRFGQRFHRMFAYMVKGPEASVTDTSEARARRQAEVVDGTAELDTRPAQTDAEGKVINMEPYRMAAEARRMADEAHAEMPGTVVGEDWLQQQAG